VNLVVTRDAEDVARTACRFVLDRSHEAVARDGQFRIALSGGSTPRRLYRMLADSDDARFECWHVFFGDERFVPPDHPESNYRMAREALLGRVPIPASQVHPVDTTAGSPERTAWLYSMTLRRRLPAFEGRPRFDLVLLGLGADGHTASLFPGSTALEAAPSEVAVATWAPSQRSWRITITKSVINGARDVAFLVSGADKADALAKTLEAGGAETVPAASIQPRSGSLTFLVDEAAAAKLSRQPETVAAL
jgi:6-phosphogluconolactonase